MLHLSEWLSSINQQSAGEDVEKGEPFCTGGGMQTGAATVESSTELPHKLKMDITFDTTIQLLGIYLKEFKILTQKNIGTPMFIAVLFIVTKIQKQPKCSTIDEWIKQLWDIYPNGILLGHKI